MATKVTTVIVNDTKHGLTMKVGNRNCYVKLTSFKVGGKYKIEIDVNWTYQEFVVQDKSDRANQLFISSDDCCDYERITIKDVDGKFDVHKDLRPQFRTSSSADGLESRCTPISSWKLWKSWLCKFIFV